MEDDIRDTALVPAPNGTGGKSLELTVRTGQSAVAQLRDRGRQLTACNGSPSSVDDQVAMVAMETVEQDSIWDDGIAEFDATYVMVREMESTNVKSGEVETRLRCVLMDGAGRAVATNSAAVARVCLSVLQLSEGRGVFYPPVTFRFKRVKTQGGGTALAASVDLADMRRIAGRG